MILYIDPGTGSMLFAAIMGIAAAGVFFIQRAWMKLKFLITGGRAKAVDEHKRGIVVYSEGKRYWNLFEPIVEEFERRGEELTYWTSDPSDPARTKSYEHVESSFIGEGNKAFARLNLLNARVCLSTTPGLDVYQWKRSRNTNWYVHLFHAIDSGTSYRMFGLDYYDAVLLTGQFQEKSIRALEELRHLPAKELPVTGVPYMDSLKKRLEEMEEKKPSSAGTEGRTVLLAPSWGQSGILSRFGGEIIEALLATGYHIIVRPHPQSFVSEKHILEPLQKKYADNPALEWNSDSDNFDVLYRSDILISDFSGVLFDFALVFGKPVLYADASYDPAPYDAWWLKEPLWQFQVLKKFGVELKREDFGRLKAVLDNAIADTSLEAARKEVQEQAWPYMGQTAERTVDYLLKKRDELAALSSNADAQAPEKSAA